MLIFLAVLVAKEKREMKENTAQSIINVASGQESLLTWKDMHILTLEHKVTTTNIPTTTKSRPS